MGAKQDRPADRLRPPDRRFTYYDHAHTTGMDIKQTALAVAAITLGKDMVLRDYAQGAWRMRGLGNGQRLEVILVPEIHRLVRGVLTAEAASSRSSDTCSPRDVLSWLTVRSCQSERVEEVRARDRVSAYSVLVQRQGEQEPGEEQHAGAVAVAVVVDDGIRCAEMQHAPVTSA